MSSIRRVLLPAALLVSTGAMRTDDAKPLVAVCVTGSTALVPQDLLRSNLQAFVQGLNGAGLVKESQPDVFAYVNLKGLGQGFKRAWEYAGQHKFAKPANLTDLFTVYKTSARAQFVTEKNLDDYIQDRHCFDNREWKGSPTALLTSLNKIYDWQTCLKGVQDKEKSSGKKYDVIVFTRPDLSYARTQVDVSAISKHNTVFSQTDKLMMLPRRVAFLLLDGKKTWPLRCSAGSSCCGMVGSSETLQEYLLGVNPAGSKSCHCGPGEDETGIMVHHPNLEVARFFGTYSQGTLEIPAPWLTPEEKRRPTELQ